MPYVIDKNTIVGDNIGDHLQSGKYFKTMKEAMEYMSSLDKKFIAPKSGMYHCSSEGIVLLPDSEKTND